MVSGAISSSQLVLSGFLPVICFSGDGVAAGLKPAKVNYKLCNAKMNMKPWWDKFSSPLSSQSAWFGSEVVLLLNLPVWCWPISHRVVKKAFLSIISLAPPLSSFVLAPSSPPLFGPDRLLPFYPTVPGCAGPPSSSSVLPPAAGLTPTVRPSAEKNPNPLSSQGFFHISLDHVS